MDGPAIRLVSSRFLCWIRALDDAKRRRVPTKKRGNGVVPLLRWFKFLDAAAPVGIGDVDTAVRVDGEAVAVREVSELVSGTAEAGKKRAARVIEYVDLLISAIHHVEILLSAVRRKPGPPRGAALVRQCRRSGAHPDVALEVAHLVENLHAIALAVADVDEPLVADRNAMHDLREHPADARLHFFRRRLAAPLAQEVAVAIEYRPA